MTDLGEGPLDDHLEGISVGFSILKFLFFNVSRSVQFTVGVHPQFGPHSPEFASCGETEHCTYELLRRAL